MNELENLLKDLYKISGLNMSIFDLNQNLLASYPHKKSKFCNELEKNNNAFQHCIDCDYKAMEHVKKTGELYIYKCHFGLNEAIMPLYSYGSLTGYLMMGQAVIGTYRNYSEIIEKSKEYFQDKEILKKYITEITIEELCSYFFCSRGTLLNHFKSKYNTTIHQYLLDYRLKKATELLINDELNVKEIAFFCGFEDPNYFSKVFKKRYGQSPLEFKNNINQ